MVKILEGKTASLNILERLKEQNASLKEKPTLAVVQVGHDEESSLYIRKKKEFGQKAGFNVNHIQLSESIEQKKIEEEIENLNEDRVVNGIIIQLPLPGHLNFFDLSEKINPVKDVDGLHSFNLKNLFSLSGEGFVPATAKGVLSLLDFYQISVSGLEVVVVGRSVLVGKPITLLLLNRDATVTVCHSQTKDLKKICKSADIIVSAVGHPGLINKDFVSSGQVIVDVGINTDSGLKMQEEVTSKKLVGDVSFDEVQKIVSAITPVPGGVGPMTVASLFENVLEAYRIQH